MQPRQDVIVVLACVAEEDMDKNEQIQDDLEAKETGHAGPLNMDMRR